MPYRNRVKSTVGGQVYSLPVNLHTINQFFGRTFRPEEARAFVAGRGRPTSPTRRASRSRRSPSSAGRPLRGVLQGLHGEAVGLSPDRAARLDPEAPAVALQLRRQLLLPPPPGHAARTATPPMVRAILDHPGIDVHLTSALDPDRAGAWDHLFWSGPLDGFFGYRLGRLGYRTLDFEPFRDDGRLAGLRGDELSATPDVPFTRITEHKHFAPWESHDGIGALPRIPARLRRRTTSPTTRSGWCAEKSLLADYVERRAEAENVTFVGRLGTYRYLDMDVTIREALDLARAFLAGHRAAGLQGSAAAYRAPAMNLRRPHRHLQPAGGAADHPAAPCWTRRWTASSSSTTPDRRHRRTGSPRWTIPGSTSLRLAENTRRRRRVRGGDRPTARDHLPPDWILPARRRRLAAARRAGRRFARETFPPNARRRDARVWSRPPCSIPTARCAR